MRSFKKFLVVTILFALSAFDLLMAQQLVHFSGSSDGKKEKYLSIRKPGFFVVEQERSALASENEETGDFDFNAKIDHPQTLIISALNKNWFVRFSPGDSVKFNITGDGIHKKLTFLGKDEAIYNLDVLVSDVAMDKGPYFGKYKDLASFKAAADEWRNTSLDSVNSFLSKHTVDKSTAERARMGINYRYVQLIYSDLKEFGKEAIPKAYFSDADKLSTALLSLRAYRSAVMRKFITSKITNDPSDLKTSYQRIVKSLNGKTRDFTLALHAGTYSLRQLQPDSGMLRKIFKELADKKLDSTYTSYLKDKEMRYFIIGKPLPQHVLNNTMLTRYDNDKAINLAQLLEAYKGEAVYIDLWASWCSPCRQDIAKSSDARKVLYEKKVAYLYFSTYTNNDAWKKAAEKDQITAHQFRFDPENSKALKGSIGLAGIPRYILLDKNHHVKSLYAPNPTPEYEKEFNKMLADLIPKNTR